MATKNIIYLDLETTGLSYDDEILQIAIIDDDANVLLNSYVKPRNKKKWNQAQGVHGITPKNVEHMPSLEDLKSKVVDIVTGKTIVIYNAEFDTKFIPYIEELAENIICCMLLFAEEYGDWNDYYENYKWKNLITASKYVKHNLEQTHNALNDVLATRAVYHYLAYDNELKTIRHKKRDTEIARFEQEQYEEDIKYLHLLIQDVEDEINSLTNNRIHIKRLEVEEAIKRYVGYDYTKNNFYRKFPYTLLKTQTVLKEAGGLGMPIITTKTIPNKYITLTENNYRSNKKYYDNNVYDAIYYNKDKYFRCIDTSSTYSYKLLFLNLNPVKRKFKPKQKLDKIDIKKLKLPIIYGVKIPQGYITESSFEDHVNTSKLQPSAYLVPKTETKYTELYKISNYNKCDYSYYRNWCEVPSKYWFTRTEMKRRFKVPHKLFKDMKTKGEIKLHGDYFYLYEVPNEYRTENIL